MEAVDDEGVRMAPAVAKVRVPRMEVGVGMLDHVGIGRRPSPDRRRDTGERHGSEDPERRRHARVGAEPTRGRVSDQSGGMDRANCAARTFGRRPHGGIGDAEDDLTLPAVPGRSNHAGCLPSREGRKNGRFD
jgi:hypothetical protein